METLLTIGQVALVIVLTAPFGLLVAVPGIGASLMVLYALLHNIRTGLAVAALAAMFAGGTALAVRMF